MSTPKYYLFILCLLALSKGYAQTQEQRSMDSVVQQFIQNRSFNGEIYVSISGKLYYRKTVGLRDKQSTDTLRFNSIFNIGSISKSVTAVAVLQQQQYGKLKIQDYVKKYIPEFPYDSIRISQLLSHTSGLMTNIEQIDGYTSPMNENNDSLLAVLIRYKPSLYFSPGADWGYSNIGYDLLAILIERVTKIPFQEYVAKHILKPAGMKQSFIPYSRDAKASLPKGVQADRLLVPHMYADITVCEVTNIQSIPWIKVHKDFVVGSSNLYSSVTDLEKFDRALQSHKILNAEMQKLMYQPYLLNNGDTAKDQRAVIPSYYALGWYVAIDKSMGDIVWHKGRSFGSRSIFIRNLNKKQIIIATDNYDYPAVDLKAVALMNILNHRPYRDPVLKSLVQDFGCTFYSYNSDSAFKKFNYLKKTRRSNYYISEEEMLALGDSLLSAGKKRDALRVYQFSTELFPESFVPFMWYAKGLLDDEQTKAALENYVKAMNLYNDNDQEREAFLNIVGYQLMTSDRKQGAEQVLKLNTELYPRSCNVYDSYASILDVNNKLHEAIANERIAVQLAKEQQHELLPQLLENLKKLEEKVSAEK